MASLPYPRLRHNPPTDSTDFHRCDLYKELPQNSRNSRKLLRRVWHPCHTHAFGIILPQIPRIFTDGTYTKNSHRIHGIHRCDLYKELLQNSEVLIQRTPTDSTDFHRWNLYKELPQNSQNSQKFRCIYCSVSMAGMPYHPIHLCKSVKSVGVFLYKYFREFRGICGNVLFSSILWER